MKKCINCFDVIPSERLQFIPNANMCVRCANKHGQKKYKGALNFLHKTGGSIMIMDPDFYDNEWKKYNPSFGRGSGVHKMSPRMAGTG